MLFKLSKLNSVSSVTTCIRHILIWFSLTVVIFELPKMEKIIVFSFLVVATTFAEPHLLLPYGEAIVLPSQDIAVPYPYHSPLVQNLGLKFYGEDHGLVDATTDVVDSKLSLGFSLIPTVVYTVIAFVLSGVCAVVKAVVVFVLAKLAMLLVAGIVAIGICKLTTICTKLSHVAFFE